MASPESKQVPSKYSTPHYNGRIFRCYSVYATNLYGPNITKEICQELGVPLDLLLSDASWFSDALLRDFLSKLKERTGDPLVAWKAGKILAAPEILNPIEYLVMTNSPAPYVFFSFLPKEWAKFNRIFITRVADFKAGSFKLVATPPKDLIPSPDCCLTAISMLSSSKDLLDLDFIEVNHSQCIHKGAIECVFEIKYSAVSHWKKKITRLGITVGILLVGFIGLEKLQQRFSASVLIMPLEVCFLLLLTVTSFMVSRYFKMLNYVSSYFQQSNENARMLSEERARHEEAQKRSNFARRISHDIRSPLAALEVAIGLEASSEDRENLIRAAIGRIRSIAEDVLVTRQPSQLRTECDVIAVVKTIIQEKKLELSGTATRITFVEDIPIVRAVALVDDSQLCRALSNILNNSIEALLGAGIILIAIERLNGRLQIRVRDNGPGIPSSIKDKVTEEGFTSGKEGGSGLGLFQVRKFADEYNCQLDINSGPGFTEVRIVLPEAFPNDSSKNLGSAV
jgi:signal transduction histidine kinase